MSEHNHSEDMFDNKHRNSRRLENAFTARHIASRLHNGMRVGSLLRTWAEISNLNYYSTETLEQLTNATHISTIMRRKSIGLPLKEYSAEDLVPQMLKMISNETLFSEVFPANVTLLMNEDQHWGCFYNFPELYADMYSPSVRVRGEGRAAAVLTRDAVAACLTYLKRTPILGDYVYIKLDLSNKHLRNIEVLQNYKYLVYLDLCGNYLTCLSVLSNLLYLQFLSVSNNSLETVLDYETPQWFLTEVHYKFNSVQKIRNLKDFWSITILDLSHNNIKSINGLESLKFLRHLDLSFNHIQRLENLNHLRILWLDVSYNNISSFEFEEDAGLWTLLHLEYLNVNENNLTSMRIFSGCTRLRELNARNNRFGVLLELAVYMRQLRRLVVLDLRANPILTVPGFKEVVMTTFPVLLNLNAEDLDPVEQRGARMNITPDVTTFATRRLLRLVYLEQLSRARVSPCLAVADSTEIPLVVLVGCEGVGKGTLARLLVEKCKDNTELASLHTTATYHDKEHYCVVSRHVFDDMILKGQFLTYTEMNGESYGLSREQAYVRDGKVRVACMDLYSALMLKLRGRRPYLIFVTCSDKVSLSKRQELRKTIREHDYRTRKSRSVVAQKPDKSTLQVLLSGRFIITGIINEILMNLPDDAENEFILESDCSILMESVIRKTSDEYVKNARVLSRHTSSASSMQEVCKRESEKTSSGKGESSSLCSLFKGSQATMVYSNDTNGQNMTTTDKKQPAPFPTKDEKISNVSRPKSVDFSKYTSSTWKGLSVAQESTKSSKSVTFTSYDNGTTEQTADPSGLLVDAPETPKQAVSKNLKSISTKMPWQKNVARTSSGVSYDDFDHWITYLVETGLLQASDTNVESSSSRLKPHLHRNEDPNAILRQLDRYYERSTDSQHSKVRDNYENIHRNCPGIFWDTVDSENINNAFRKLKNIVKDIVNSQPKLKPMFDIDFANLEDYPTVEKKVNKIRKMIAPQRLFY